MCRPPTFSRAVPFLASGDLEAAVAFYTEVLGFSLEWSWGEPPSDVGLRRDSVELFLHRAPHIAANAAGHEVVIFVEGVAALYAEHQARHAPISSPLETKEWGVREYTVRDPSGYLLRFSEPADEAPPERLP